MADLLFEIFSEEIPARMQAEALHQLVQALLKALESEKLTYSDYSNFVTPRRLGIIVKDIPAKQEDATIEKKGPKTTAPQAAIDGFLKSTGLTLDRLEKRMVGKDETYFAVTEQKGQPTFVVLKAILEKILTDFTWPKSMRWGSGETRWVRPLHSLLCLFDGEVIPIEFAGLKAGRITYGLRFLAPAAITISSVDEYLPRLKAAYVLGDALERRKEIVRQAEALTAQHNLTFKRDEGLLTEVTGLVEWPTVLMGTIDADFMDLPPEVLTSEMRAHQKYFALLNQDKTFSNRFLIVSNMIAPDEGKAIIAGNERVLRARLSDGRFFFDQDRKIPLSEWAKKLDSVTFHAKVGTIAEKVTRIETLALQLAQYVKGADNSLVTKAAQLCKADLVTGMVGEFPDLQGIMGRYYALAQNENAAVADAIRDHYLPLGPDSPIPTAPVSICIALADKFDTLISLFAVGEKPTGSKDPLALRRSALGIIRIILENGLRFNLNVVLSKAKDLAQDSSASPHNDQLTGDLLAFFSDRLKVMLRDKGIRHDVIAAVMADGDDDLVRVVARAKALQEFLATEDGANLLAAYKRASNIVSIEEKKDNQRYEKVENELFEIEEEKNLSQTLAIARKSLSAASAHEKFIEAMAALAILRQPLDRFFDKVMVNCENKNLRKTRLGLLNAIRETMNGYANFALIEG